MSDRPALEERACEIRKGLLVGIYSAGSGHPGGSLSCADLLAYMTSPEVGWLLDAPEGERAHFVLSKGHACPAMYAAAASVGVLDFEQLYTFRRMGSNLQGHPHATDLPWVEASTGSLGQGFSFAVGVALGLRHLNRNDRVYALLGDGELQEGMVWEAAMSAAHHELENLCAVVDYNKMQSDDLNANIMGLEPLAAKWESFNWHVLEIDGHDFDSIAGAFEAAKVHSGQPTVIVAHTAKGRGVSYMEGVPAWHGSVCLSREQLADALRDLGVDADEIERCCDAGSR